MLDDIDYPPKVHFAVRAVVHVCAERALNLQRKINSVNWEGAIHVVFFNFHSSSHMSPPPPLSLSVSLSLSLSFSLSTSLSPFISRIHARNAEDWAGNGVGHVYRHSETLLARFWAPSRNPLLLLQPLPRYREYVYTATINYAVMPGAIISKIDKTTDNLDRLW